MECMKCGRKIEDGQVFCPECLEVMAGQPVSRETVIHLPVRPTPPRRPVSRKPEPTPQERIGKLRRTVRTLWICIAVLAVLLAAVTTALTLSALREPAGQDIGKNYSTIAPAPITKK